MDEQMLLLWSKFKEELHLQTSVITQKVTASVSETIEEKLKPIIEENQTLKNEVRTLKTKIQHLEKEARKNNIILHEIPETESNNQELMNNVLGVLNNLSKKSNINEWDIWEISQATRLGKKKENKTRPILLRLTLEWRKIEILKNNKQFPEKIYATQDFPKEVLDKRRELKIQLAEETKNGKTAFIRYDKLIVKDKVEKRKRSPSKSTESTPTSNGKKEAPSKLCKTSNFPKTITRTYSGSNISSNILNK